jgi:hypothetical protein
MRRYSTITSRFVGGLIVLIFLVVHALAFAVPLAAELAAVAVLD